MSTEEKTRRELLADRITTASQRSLAVQAILVLSAFAGLCGSIFPILKSFGLSDAASYLITAGLTVAVIGTLLAFFFIHSWKVYLVRATVAMLVVLCLVLSALLYWQYALKTDDWASWKERVTASVKDCEKSYQQQRLVLINKPGYSGNDALSNEYDAKVACVGNAIKEPYPHQGTETALKIVELDNDDHAGAYLMENPIVFDVLKTRLSIGQRFLGTGFALPATGETYGQARLIEYMVPNLSEQDSKVLAWQITPLPNLSQTVECLMLGCAQGKHEVKPTLPTNISSASDQKYRDIIEYLKDPTNRTDENKVILIRLNQFNKLDQQGRENYSKHLGRIEASSVFMIRLRDVWNVSLKEAITLSGHEGSGDTLFVWVYIPTAESAITLATWKNIIPNIDKLLKKT